MRTELELTSGFNNVKVTLTLTRAIWQELMEQKPNTMSLRENGRRKLRASINYLYKNFF